MADDDPAGDPQQALAAAERTVERRRLVLKLRDLVEQLPAREHRVLQAYYLQQRRLRDTAQEMSITESRVSQIHSRARTRLQMAIRERHRTRTRAPREPDAVNVTRSVQIRRLRVREGP